MKRIAIALLILGVAGCAQAGHPQPAPTVTKTIHTSVTIYPPQKIVPGPTVTRFIPGQSRILEGIPCYEQGGKVFLFDVNPGPKPPVTYCHLVPVSPASSLDFTVVAADGTSGGVYGPVG